MDLHDLDDSYDLYDPDYGDNTLALWGESDVLEISNDDAADSDNDAEGYMGLWPSAPPQYLGIPWEIPRCSTIRQYNEVMDLRVQRIHSLRAQSRTAASSQSFVLEDTFFGNEQPSPCHAPSPAPPRGAGLDGSDTLVRTWLDARTPLLDTLRNLTLWVRGAGIASLTASELGAIYHLAWNLFCATLRFPQTRIAFETFTANPVASPEVTRFRLLGVGPFGPPPPPHGPHFLAKWGTDHLHLSHNDLTDLRSASVAAVHYLEVGIQWVLDAPVSFLTPVVLGEVSLTCWELFVASLRIPQALLEFESLCSDPPALREAAGLILAPTGAANIVSHRPPRANKRRVRR